MARTSGCAPPERLLFRQDVVDRIAAEDGNLQRLDGCGIPYQVTDSIAVFPGFHIVRETW